MHIPNQGVCQSRKTNKNMDDEGQLVDFANQGLAHFANTGLGTFTSRWASMPGRISRSLVRCLASLQARGSAAKSSEEDRE
jgi:hypothetical protein